MKFIKAIIKRSSFNIWLHNYIHNIKIRNLLDILLFPVALICYSSYRIRNISSGGRDKIAVVAIIKNESLYLKEWIDYYLNVIHVDHIYLYDNDSNDDTDLVLDSYVRNGVVSLLRIHGKKRQHDAYNDALNRFGCKFEYMCFFDLDEFLYTDGEDLIPFLDRNLTGHKAGFAVNWLMFGSSGLIHMPLNGVINNFVYRSNYDYKKNYHIKTICRPEKVVGFVNAHYPIYHRGCYAVSSNGEIVEGAFGKPIDPGMKLFHYFTKSKEEFLMKISKGKADDGLFRSEKEFMENDFNNVYDDRLVKVRKDG